MRMVNMIKVLLIAFLGFAPLAHASKALPVMGQPMHAEMSFDNAKKVFIQAGAKRGWVVKPAEEAGKLIADIWVRSHYVSVFITVHKDSYDITYRDSENMKYQPDGTIHRKYNGWVKNFNGDIQKQMLMASK